MGDTVEGNALLHGFTDGGVVADVRMKQSFSDSFAEFVKIGMNGEFSVTEKNLARQTETVGVRSVGGNTDGNMSRSDFGSVDNFGAFNDTGDHTDQIKVIAVHAGHFSSFAAEDSAVGFTAGFGNAA